MYVHSLSLTNIKAFEELTLPFRRSAEANSLTENPYAGLNIFVGGNASGKSTLLKCIAMALSGPTVATQQLLSPTGWLRHGTKMGEIRLDVRWDSDYDGFQGEAPKGTAIELGLAFKANRAGTTTIGKAKPADARVKSAEQGPWNADTNGWFLGAYGPLRRLTGSSLDADRYARVGGKLASCVTLFREDASLNESEIWLRQEFARELERQSQNLTPSTFSQQILEFLNSGLLPKGFRLSKVTVDHVYMMTPNGGELPMRDLSDGYRSAFALMLDILYTMRIAYPVDPAKPFFSNREGQWIVDKPGVILIDELEAHLHPAWQHLICEWLRTHFPQVQFFLSTHSPLIAQAAERDGLFVLPLPQEIASGQQVRRLQPHEQARITLGNAERVLLGEAFGLEQTWSPRAERLVQEWKRLDQLRHLKGSLPPDKEEQYEALLKQMEIVFDFPLEEARDA